MIYDNITKKMKDFELYFQKLLNYRLLYLLYKVLIIISFEDNEWYIVILKVV